MGSRNKILKDCIVSGSFDGVTFEYKGMIYDKFKYIELHAQDMILWSEFKLNTKREALIQKLDSEKNYAITEADLMTVDKVLIDKFNL